MTPIEPGRWVVDAYEATLSDAQRRRGAHYTPTALARTVVELALDAYCDEQGRLPDTVVDPTCGAGAFLLAAAEGLRRRGADPTTILTRVLIGVDIDPGAVHAARRALREWGRTHGADVRSTEPAVHVGDTLATGLQPGSGDPAARRLAEGVDLVVGNPPFQSQLSASTARDDTQRERVLERHGLLGAYADTAAIHLLDACTMLRPGGVAAMVQPVSMLSARDAEPIRQRLMSMGHLVALWGSDERHFDAAVHICVPVLRHDPGNRPAAPRQRSPEAATTLVVHAEHGPPSRVPAPRDGSSWSPLLAHAAGIPILDGAATNGTLASLADATAGFRDEFYALAHAATERDQADGDLERRLVSRALVSVGMIDPLWLRHGHGRFRIAGEQMVAPVVDLEALATEAPRVARWVEGRNRPKVLVATQTKVIEAVVDPVGDLIPLTPTVSVEPRPGIDPWLVAVMLISPPSAARLAAAQWGSGRSTRSLRVPARLLLDLPCPAGRTAWEQAAALAREVASCGSTAPARGDLERIGQLMLDAYDLGGDRGLLQWWVQRIPRR